MLTITEPKHYGKRVSIKTTSKAKIHISPHSSLHGAYSELKSGNKIVLLAIIHLCSDSLNTIFIGGNTLKELSKETGFTEPSIRNAVTKLKLSKLIEPTLLRGEYIVNPLYAIKGSCSLVWRNYQRIEGQLREAKGAKAVPLHYLYCA
jgi:hypothetical protein